MKTFLFNLSQYFVGIRTFFLSITYIQKILILEFTFIIYDVEGTENWNTITYFKEIQVSKKLPRTWEQENI